MTSVNKQPRLLAEIAAPFSISKAHYVFSEPPLILPNSNRHYWHIYVLCSVQGYFYNTILSEWLIV